MLSLLKPLTPRELADLAANDHVPNEAVDWLLERETPAADVCLLFGQGIKSGREQCSCQWEGDDGRANDCDQCRDTGWIDKTWHLPQATFAVWSQCLYGAERRRAVEAWSIKEEAVGRHYRWQTSDSVWEVCGAVDGVPVAFVWDTQEKALRDLRRRVLRLFPEVKRTQQELAIEVEIRVGGTSHTIQGPSHGQLGRLDLHPGAEIYYQCPTGETKHGFLPLALIGHKGGTLIEWNIRAEDFAPPVPEYGPSPLAFINGPAQVSFGGHNLGRVENIDVRPRRRRTR